MTTLIDSLVLLVVAISVTGVLGAVLLTLGCLIATYREHRNHEPIMKCPDCGACGCRDCGY